MGNAVIITKKDKQNYMDLQNSYYLQQIEILLKKVSPLTRNSLTGLFATDLGHKDEIYADYLG